MTLELAIKPLAKAIGAGNGLRLTPGCRAMIPWQLGRRVCATAADERISRIQPC